MPLTYTGRRVSPGNYETPSLVDIAVGLSRQPRFAGQTRAWWSVLDHTLFGDALITALGPSGQDRGLRVSWLLHDAHEAITGDVPTDVKRATDMGAVQAQLDTLIFGAFHPDHDRGALWAPTVKRWDRVALVAEAHEIGPPAGRQAILEAFGVVEDEAEAREILLELYGTGRVGTPPGRNEPEKHPGVVQYLALMQHLM